MVFFGIQPRNDSDQMVRGPNTPVMPQPVSRVLVGLEAFDIDPIRNDLKPVFEESVCTQVIGAGV